MLCGGGGGCPCFLCKKKPVGSRIPTPLFIALPDFDRCVRCFAAAFVAPNRTSAHTLAVSFPTPYGLPPLQRLPLSTATPPFFSNHKCCCCTAAHLVVTPHPNHLPVPARSVDEYLERQYESLFLFGQGDDVCALEKEIYLEARLKSPSDLSTGAGDVIGGPFDLAAWRGDSQERDEDERTSSSGEEKNIFVHTFHAFVEGCSIGRLFFFSSGVDGDDGQSRIERRHGRCFVGI